jgi:hemin uptake protein HemP
MSAAHIEESPPPPRTSSAPPTGEPFVSIKDLPGDVHRIWIEQAAQTYLLQVTRSAPGSARD